MKKFILYNLVLYSHSIVCMNQALQNSNHIFTKPPQFRIEKLTKDGQYNHITYINKKHIPSLDNLLADKKSITCISAIPKTLIQEYSKDILQALYIFSDRNGNAVIHLAGLEQFIIAYFLYAQGIRNSSLENVCKNALAYEKISSSTSNKTIDKKTLFFFCFLALCSGIILDQLYTHTTAPLFQNFIKTLNKVY